MRLGSFRVQTRRRFQRSRRLPEKVLVPVTDCQVVVSLAQLKIGLETAGIEFGRLPEGMEALIGAAGGGQPFLAPDAGEIDGPVGFPPLGSAERKEVGDEVE